MFSAFRSIAEKYCLKVTVSFGGIDCEPIEYEYTWIDIRCSNVFDMLIRLLAGHAFREMN